MLIATVLVISMAASVAVFARWRKPATLTEELAEIEMLRIYATQFSVPTKFRPCRIALTPGRIPSADCLNRVRVQVPKELEGRISTQADSGNRDAIHADALVDFELDDVKHSGLSRIIERLQLLVRGRYRTEDSLADLSAAYLVRAGREQQVLDLFRALEAAERAIAINQTHQAALYNRALALQGLTLDSEASKAWRAYLTVDSTSGWATEARQYEALLRGKLVPIPPANADDSTLAAFAVASPQQARELGWDVLLGQWGAEVMHDDTAAARAALHRSAVLARELENRRGDASLAEEVRIIEAHGGDKDATNRLASAHRFFSSARIEYVRINYAAADTLFDRAFQAGADSPVLRAWVRGFYGATHRGEDPVGSLRMVRAAVVGVDTARYPALGGRFYWTLAVLLVKENDQRSAAAYGTAVRLFERAGEPGNTADVLSGQAEAEAAVGNETEEYYATWYRAASLLRRHRNPQSLHRQFAAMSRRLVTNGFPWASSRVDNELSSIAEHSSVNLLVVEARDIRAEGLARSGEMDAALAEVAAAEPLVGTISDTIARKHFTAMLRATRGIAEVGRNPLMAEARLSSIIPSMRRAGVPPRFVTALLARADARAMLGRTDSARADLLEALQLIRTGRIYKTFGLSRGAGPDARASLDRVVARLVGEGRDTAALALLELGTTALAQVEPAPLPAAIPGGRVVVRYAFAGDTILAWTMSGRDVRVTRTPVSQAHFRERLDTLLTLLEQREDSLADAELRRMHNWLIRPLESRLGARNSSLVIVPDETMENVPFAALRNPRGEYLLGRFVIRVARSVAGAVVEPGADRASPVVGVVQDPAIDRQLYPDLRQLRGASDEVAALNGWRPSVLAGTRASGDSVRGLLSRVSLFHFAGHAIADPLMPDSSFLVLAAGPGPDDLGRLTAADIASMELPGLDLVVLSACSTLGGSEAGSGGFAGLSGAFLGAGAKGVIGSLWSVYDTRTRKLVEGFYAAYRTNRDPAAALRQAQRDMLSSPDERWKRPSAWAAFEYVGR
ncbi:MAG TPA: CHAT domain-containing protein [Longimicrobium sp.]